MKTQKITQKFIEELFVNDFQLSSSEENTRMYGNTPTLETVITHWCQKNEIEVRYILTDNGPKSKFNRSRLIKILTMAVNDILEGNNGFDFLNSGYPVDFSKYIKITA